MLVNVTGMAFLWRCLLAIPVFFLLSFTLSHSAHASLQAEINRLLDRADTNLAADQLLTPAKNNAYNQYRAVLLLDPSNQRAALGLRAIAERYLVFAHAHKRRGQFASAKKMVANAVTVNGRTSATTQMLQAIRKAEQRPPPVAKVVTPRDIKPTDDRQTMFKLNPRDLKQRNQAMVDQLFSLGKRVQNTREYVLIYARNDAEGRWIYQQLRQASVGYRVRGNIKRNKTPRVVLEKPLD